MKTVLTSLLLLVAAIFQGKQFPESDAETYKAYLSNQDAKEQWKKIVSERDGKGPADNKEVQYASALARFGLLSATMRDKDEDLCRDYCQPEPEF